MRLGAGGNSELSPLERRVMLAMFVGRGEEIPVLESQLRATSVISRNYSGVGFVSKFEIRDETQCLDFSIRRIEGRHPRLPAAVEFVLTLKNGRLDTLEAFAFNGMWPDEEAGFEFD